MATDINRKEKRRRIMERWSDRLALQVSPPPSPSAYPPQSPLCTCSFPHFNLLIIATLILNPLSLIVFKVLFSFPFFFLYLVSVILNPQSTIRLAGSNTSFTIFVICGLIIRIFLLLFAKFFFFLGGWFVYTQLLNLSYLSVT